MKKQFGLILGFALTFILHANGSSACDVNVKNEASNVLEIQWTKDTAIKAEANDGTVTINSEHQIKIKKMRKDTDSFEITVQLQSNGHFTSKMFLSLDNKHSIGLEVPNTNGGYDNIAISCD